MKNFLLNTNTTRASEKLNAVNSVPTMNQRLELYQTQDIVIQPNSRQIKFTTD